MTSCAGMSCPVCGTGRTFHVGSGTLRVVEDSPGGVTVEHAVSCPVCGRAYVLRTECRAVRTELVAKDGAVLAESDMESRRGVTDATERFKY